MKNLLIRLGLVKKPKPVLHYGFFYPDRIPASASLEEFFLIRGMWWRDGKF